MVFVSVAAHAWAVDDRFGVMTHFAQGWDPRIVPLVARTGLHEVRDELYWNRIEPERGKYVFPAAYDRYMASLRQQRVSPLVVLSFENPNYDGGNTPYTDEGIAAFARYAVEVLRHFPREIRAVEVWNEYNGTFCHGPATKDRAANYVRLLKATYTAVKRVRPDVTVVGGATSGMPLPYWNELLARGALEWLDVLSIHPYRYESPPEGIERDVGRLRTLQQEYGRPKPIWVTEIGWIVQAPKAPGELSVDEDTQAQFLVRACTLLLAGGVDRVYWYLFRDDPGLAMGIVRNDAAHTPRLADTAISTLIAELQGARYVSRDPTPRDIYSLRFVRGDGEDVRVIWSLQPHRLKVSGARRAVDLKGMPLATGGGLDIGTSPAFVTGALEGLPRATDVVIADPEADFGARQGERGWYYGAEVGHAGVFTPLPAFTHDDWHYTWGNGMPYLGITSTDQHPSVANGQPVTVVRRWQSNYAGAVEVAGSFRSQPAGDGVGVRVDIDGQPRIREQLGGGKPISTQFDFTVVVRPGTTIDFTTDPGPGANINSDAAVLNVAISRPTS